MAGLSNRFTSHHIFLNFEYGLTLSYLSRRRHQVLAMQGLLLSSHAIV